jgi:hypothetical protein
MADTETYRLSRTSSGDAGTAEPIGISALDDLPRAVAGQRAPRVSIYGRHAQFLNVTAVDGVLATGFYPSDGAGQAQSGGLSVIRLAADAPVFDLAGQLIVLTGGAGAGQARYGAAYNGGTKDFTPNADFSPAPDSTTTYLLLVPTVWCSYLHCRAEFEDAAGSAPAALVTPVFFGFPYGIPSSGTFKGQAGVAAGATARIPVPFDGKDFELENMDSAAYAVQSGYRRSRTYSDDCRGAIGAKLWLRTAPAQGKVALWACAT